MSLEEFSEMIEFLVKQIVPDFKKTEGQDSIQFDFENDERMITIDKVESNGEPYFKLKFFYPYSDYVHHNMIEELQLSAMNQNLHVNFLQQCLDDYFRKIRKSYSNFDENKADDQELTDEQRRQMEEASKGANQQAQKRSIIL